MAALWEASLTETNRAPTLIDAMKIPPQTFRIGAASVIILGTIIYLAITGVQADKSYYVTIQELQSMGGKAYTRNLRVAGSVQPGTIARDGSHATFVLVEQDRKLGLLQMMLRDEQGSFLVFARTKHGADRLAKKLSRDGVKTATIHGNRSQNQRTQALRGFQDGYYRVLVATDIAARGIHVEGISHVVNYDLPQVPEDFIHRVGRTGRAGAGGTASTFATRGERADIAHIERILATRLERRQVSPDVGREQKIAAPVVEFPFASPRPQQRRVRSFAPRRRAV